ncbi:hypothetical protein Misp06_02334 [Microbulbifer sp. NBRC 101763]|uniref:hypothetical protein n=1 Tax=Microbulbifer sp. NBRC 101763 TaxID=1113820 RepID=UPI00309CDC4D
MPNNPIGNKIYPTGGASPLVDVLMNRGSEGGNPIYIHYTSQAGFNRILMIDKFIKGTPDRTRRGLSAKTGVYLTPSTQCFSPSDAHTLLFFSEDRYKNSATHMFIFIFKQGVELEDYAVSSSSPYRELIYRGDVDFRANGNAKMLYGGRNRFIDGNPWN